MYNINAKSTQARQSYKPRAEGATLPRNFQFRIWDNKEKDWGGGKVHNNALYFTIERGLKEWSQEKIMGQEPEMLVYTRVMGSRRYPGMKLGTPISIPP